MPYRELILLTNGSAMGGGGARERGSAITIGDTLTIEILREQNSGVRGHGAAPARILNVVASAVDAAVF